MHAPSRQGKWCTEVIRGTFTLLKMYENPRGSVLERWSTTMTSYCTVAVAGSTCSTAKLLFTCSLVLSLRISAASR